MLPRLNTKFLIVAPAIILFMTTIIYSQTTDTLWSKTYGGSESEIGRSVQETSDGGYIITGNTESYGAGKSDVWLIKTDTNGDSLWTKTFGGIESEDGYSVQQTTDGGYIITGNTESYGAGTSDVWLIKTDTNGDSLWSKTYGGSEHEYGYSVQQTTDGGYIITGNTESYGAGTSDVWLIKTDTNGDTLWTKTFGGSEYDRGRSVQETSDGAYIITGSTSSYGSGSSDVWLIKTDTNGDSLWSKTYGGSEHEYGYSVQQTTDGGYIITGSTQSYGAGKHDVWLLKTNMYGDSLWSKTYGGSGAEKGFSVQETSDNGFIITGYTMSYGSGGFDAWLLKTNMNGDSLWSKNFGGTESDIVYSVQETFDSLYVIVGWTESFGAGNRDLYFIKTGKPKVSQPDFYPLSGSFSTPQKIEITSSTKDSKIYYTTDGSVPTEGSILYIEPIYFDSSATLFAKAYKDHMYPSDLSQGNYNINQNISIIISADSIWFDSDYDGLATGFMDATQTNNSFGSLSSYKWFYNNEIISTDSIANITLPSGTNKVFIEVRGDKGGFDIDSVFITVYSAKLSTNGAIHSSVSQSDKNNFIVSSLDDKIYSFDSTGSNQWSIITGGEIQSTNCVDNDNNIYVGSNDTRIYSFNEEGIPNWDKSMGGIINSSPSVSPEGILYVGISTGRMMALTKTGDVIWSYQTDGAIESSPSISLDNFVYFGSNDGKLYSLKPNGELNWFFTTDDSITSSPALSADSSVVIGSTDGYLYKITKAGALSWKYQTSGPIHSSPVIEANGTILLGSDDGFLYSISKAGNLNWKYDCGNPVRSTPSISNDNLIYFGDNGGKLNVLDESGNLKWYLQTGDQIIASPLITDNGLIYTGSYDNSVYILKSHLLASGKVSAESLPEWPTFKGNYRRTGISVRNMTSMQIPEKKIPLTYNLRQNYPNPFNPDTKIIFSLPENIETELSVYNVLGKKLTTLVCMRLAAGYYEFKFDGSNLSSGLYFYVLKSGKFLKVKKMLLVK